MTKQQILNRMEEVLHIYELRETEKLNNPNLDVLQWETMYAHLKGVRDGMKKAMAIIEVWMD